MANYAKQKTPITTIWKQTNSSKVLQVTLEGLPYGTPRLGETVRTEYGEAFCSGVVDSKEIQLTIK